MHFDFYAMLVELMYFGSFASIWYWIIVAMTWSMSSHFLISVPYDLLLRARSKGGALQEDVDHVVHVAAGRFAAATGRAGIILAGIGGVIVSVLFVLGFLYGREFCQAAFLLVFPYMFVLVLSVRCALDIRTRDLRGEALFARLKRHRVIIQAIGMVSLFITVMWGVYQIVPKVSVPY